MWRQGRGRRMQKEVEDKESEEDEGERRGCGGVGKRM